MHHCFNGTFGAVNIMWGWLEANKGSRYGSVLSGHVGESEKVTTVCHCVELGSAKDQRWNPQ